MIQVTCESAAALQQAGAISEVKARRVAPGRYHVHLQCPRAQAVLITDRRRVREFKSLDTITRTLASIGVKNFSIDQGAELAS